MTPCAEALPGLLDDLRALVPDEDVPLVDELARRLAERVVRVLVAGEAKRGKSTLINALLGRDLLPTGVVPVTALATTLLSGDPECVVARHADGRERLWPLESLSELVTEQGNPANRRGLASVEVRLRSPLLAGLEMVDTPGVGSVHEHNTAEAEDALRAMDAAVFVLSADPPVSASERAFLRRVREAAVRVFCVLGKADRLDQDELAEALAFTRTVLAEELRVEETVYPLSARGARSAPGGDAGFDRFAHRLYRYLHDEASEDLTRSVAAHAARLAGSVGDTHEVTLATLALAEQDLHQRLDRFAAIQAEVQRQRHEAEAVVTAEFRRLRSTTDQRAADLVRAELPGVRRIACEHALHAAGAPAAVEAEALDLIARRIRGILEAWRADGAAELESAVADLETRMTRRLSDQVQAVRAAAAELFDVPLPPVPPPSSLPPAGRFGYSFAPEVGHIELLTAAVRTHLPRRLARGRIAAHAADRASELLDRHVGRCAAAFREQLAETQRNLGRELDRRFAEGAGRVAAAIDTAAHLRTTDQEKAAVIRERAGTALTAARQLAQRAAQASGPPPTGLTAPGGGGHRDPSTT